MEHINLADDSRYRAAILHCASNILPMHFGEKLINKIFGRSLQSHAAGLLAVMHCQAQLGLGEAPTLSAIQQSFGKSRTLSSFFALLRLAGYMKAVPADADRRVLIMVPQPPLLDGLRTWLAHHMTCCELMGMIAPGTAQRMREEEGYAVRFLAESETFLAATRAAVKDGTAWSWFDAHDCGDRIALVLLKAHYESAVEGAGWFSLETRSIAERLGISHSHVRNVLNGAEARGYILQDRSSHRIAVTQLFAYEVREWYLRFWGGISHVDRHTETPAGGLSSTAIPSPA